MTVLKENDASAFSGTAVLAASGAGAGMTGSAISNWSTASSGASEGAEMTCRLIRATADFFGAGRRSNGIVAIGRRSACTAISLATRLARLLTGDDPRLPANSGSITDKPAINTSKAIFPPSTSLAGRFLRIVPRRVSSIAPDTPEAQGSGD